VERKVHYERWTGETSSKDRFSVSESQVMSLLRGQSIRLVSQSTVIITQTTCTSINYSFLFLFPLHILSTTATTITTTTHGIISVAKKHEALANEIQSMVNEYELYPTLRVDYLRLAFQPPDHDHVRVSIDLNMRYINEKTSHMDWRTGEDQLSASDELLFPYSVVEIKLREPYISHPPAWLSQLENSSLMHKENNFSKYLHGTYEFYNNQLKNSANIDSPLPMVLKKPVWFDNISFTSPQMAVVSMEDIEKAKKIIKKRQDSTKDSTHWFARLLRLKTDVDEQGRPVRVEPKTFFANERTFLTWFNCSIFVCSIGVAITSTTDGTKVVGGLLIFIGLLISVYACMTYAQRTFSLLNKQAQGYADRFGPIILATVIGAIYVGAYFITVFGS
jgi:uncharacterized membrane protein YidH (DUF202 family)